MESREICSYCFRELFSKLKFPKSEDKNFKIVAHIKFCKFCGFSVREVTTIPLKASESLNRKIKELLGEKRGG